MRPRTAWELRPDVVVMDIAMPGLNGIEATRRIAAELSGVKVLCLSMHGEIRFVEAALEAGAAGCLLKDSSVECLVQAVGALMAGRKYLSPGAAGAVVDVLRGKRLLADSSAYTVLSEREREVLQLLAEGHTTKGIASKLFISTKTVATHREHLMGKLHIERADVRSNLGLIRLKRVKTSPRPTSTAAPTLCHRNG